jgi:hypothetical protein
MDALFIVIPSSRGANGEGEGYAGVTTDAVREFRTFLLMAYPLTLSMTLRNLPSTVSATSVSAGFCTN